MKKLLVVLTLFVFVGVYAASAQVPQDKVKTETVAKDKKATKAAAKAGKTEAKACCSESAKAGCASTCAEAAACKGMKEEKKK